MNSQAFDPKLARQLLSSVSSFLLRRTPELRQAQLGPRGASPRHHHSCEEMVSSFLGSMALDRENVPHPCPKHLEKKSDCLTLGEKIRIISWGQKGTTWHQSCHGTKTAKLRHSPDPPHGARLCKYSSRRKRPLIYSEYHSMQQNCS